jgi:hypothetical protein
MRFLFDVNVLLAGIWKDHPHHDHYLAELARKHHWKLATLDGGIVHPAAERLP